MYILHFIPIFERVNVEFLYPQQLMLLEYAQVIGLWQSPMHGLSNYVRITRWHIYYIWMFACYQ